MDFARTLEAPELDDTLQGEIDRIQSAWLSSLADYGTEDGFLFGRFSVADCMYVPVVSRFLTYSIPMPDTLMAYCQRIMALPAMKEWLAGAQQEIADGLPNAFVFGVPSP